MQPVGSDQAVPVDVRVVAASHRDLAALVREGRFREDLFYRLAVLPLQVPPLRQRRAAIVPLFQLFLSGQARLSGRTLELSDEAAEELRHRPWPGNVRQLENVARRVALLAPGPVVELDDLPAPQEGSTAEAGVVGDGDVLRVRFDTDPWEITFPRGGMELPDLEAAFVREAIKVHGGNKSAASRFLGIPRHILLYRLEKYGIEPDDLLP